jgi:hypothetical protein
MSNYGRILRKTPRRQSGYPLPRYPLQTREDGQPQTTADDARLAGHVARKALRAITPPKEGCMKLKVLSGEGLRLHGVAYGPGEVCARRTRACGRPVGRCGRR